jgi:putative membrane protein
MRSEYRLPLIVLGVLVLIVLLMPMLGGGMMGPGMMGGYGPPGGWSWGWGLAMGLGMLAMLAFWGALIVGVVLLVRWLMTATSSPGGRSDASALEILKRRYAAGEITREEYLQLRQELEK